MMEEVEFLHVTACLVYSFILSFNLILIKALLLLLLLINLFIFERESVSEGGAERERETQNPKRAPGSELSAQSLMQGLNPCTTRSCPELKSDASLTEPLRHPKALLFFFFNFF